MSKEWRARQSATRELVSSAADYVLSRPRISTDALYGLCQLTWITKDYLKDGAGYIKRAKLPGLANVYGRDVSKTDLEAAAKNVAAKLGDPKAARIIKRHTGITNLRNAYRNTARIWIEQNRAKVVDIIKRSRSIKSDADGLKITELIAQLPGIPLRMVDGLKPTSAANLLTPVVFSLDPRYRFPVINGNPGIRKLLQGQGVKNATLSQQYSAMVKLIGRGGILDAGELDLCAQEMKQFQKGMTAVLQRKPESGPELKIKDEADIEVVAKGGSRQRKALHNTMTNIFREKFEDLWSLSEGKNKAKYDIQVVGFDGDLNLLIEAKSSADEADIRMAIGQLYAYSFHLEEEENYKAILLPSKPARRVCELIEFLKMGLLWYSPDWTMKTQTDWLAEFVKGAAKIEPRAPQQKL